MAAPSNDARAAGRGGLAIAGAKIAFILLGFVQQLLLPIVLGDAGYGDVSLVLANVGVVNNVVVATSIQGVSKAVAGAPPEEMRAVLRRALFVHATFASAIALAFGASATFIARFENATRIEAPLRLVAAVVLLYGLYAPLVGALNGMRRFGAQAGLDVTYQVLRTIGLAGGGYVLAKRGSGVMGSLLGFTVAAAIILPAAAARSGLGAKGATSFTTKSYLKSLAPLLLQQTALSLLMQTDFLLLSRFLGAAAGEAGKAEAAAYLGVQRAVQLFGFLPYQLLMSVTFVLFPLLARAKSFGDPAEVKATTREGVRLTFVVTGLMSATIAGLAPHVLRFAYGKNPQIYEAGAAPLRIYALGLAAFSVLGVTTAALVSLGKERRAALITALAIAFVAAGSFALVRPAALGAPMLVRSAIATSIGMTLGLVLAALALRSAAGAFTSPLTILRVALAGAVAVAVGSRLPWLGRPAVLAEAAIVALAYAAVLVLSREIGKADLDRIKKVAGRR